MRKILKKILGSFYHLEAANICLQHCENIILCAVPRWQYLQFLYMSAIEVPVPRARLRILSLL